MTYLQERYCLDEQGNFNVSAFLFPMMLVTTGSSHILDWLLKWTVQGFAWYFDFQEHARPFSAFMRRGVYRVRMQDRFYFKFVNVFAGVLDVGRATYCMFAVHSHSGCFLVHR